MHAVAAAGRAGVRSVRLVLVPRPASAAISRQRSNTTPAADSNKQQRYGRPASTQAAAAATEVPPLSNQRPPHSANQDVGDVTNYDLTFDDFRTAFSRKSLWELVRALSVLRMCSYETVANHSLKLMTLSEQVMGQRLATWVLEKTVYGQFVAGETDDEIQENVGRMGEMGVGPLLAAPMEDDIQTDRPGAAAVCDANLATILHGMDLARRCDPVHPMTQLKLTALMPGDLVACLSERVASPADTPAAVEALAAALTGQALDVDKVFGAGIPLLLQEHLHQGIARVAQVCQLAKSSDVIVMVDAEYTYLNPCINLFALAMSLVCNDPALRKPVVFYTYQNYLQRTAGILAKDLAYLEQVGVGFGAKMVRGAYVTSEQARAERLGEPDPIHPGLDATSRAYDAAVTSVLSKMAARPGSYRMIVASHNEASVLTAVKGIESLGIDPKGGSVFFGQLMGMADHISCNLGAAGFLARKSLPYGPVKDTLPYLSRRAMENKAIFAGARRERGLLNAEFKARLSFSGSG